MFRRRGLYRKGHWLNVQVRNALVVLLYGRYKAIATYGDELLPTSDAIWAENNFLVRVGGALQKFRKAVRFLDKLARKEYNAKQRSNSDRSIAP